MPKRKRMLITLELNPKDIQRKIEAYLKRAKESKTQEGNTNQQQES